MWNPPVGGQVPSGAGQVPPVGGQVPSGAGQVPPVGGQVFDFFYPLSFIPTLSVLSVSKLFRPFRACRNRSLHTRGCAPCYLFRPVGAKNLLLKRCQCGIRQEPDKFRQWADKFRQEPDKFLSLESGILNPPVGGQVFESASRRTSFYPLSLRILFPLSLPIA